MSSKLLLANIDYATHMTDEGQQLQRGLEEAGWALAGFGYKDGCKDVPTLIERYKPSRVLVHDKRDWDSKCGAFRKGLEFGRLNFLQECKDIFKLTVVKDAGSLVEYHREVCEEVGADAVVTYYHDQSVLPVAPFLKNYTRIRTYHSVNADVVPEVRPGWRRRALVSGAVGDVYPLRRRVMNQRKMFSCDILPHPGYSNRGVKTQDYLHSLADYRVHVATASRYGFALRKIIESVACGTTPVTDLPAYDVLPNIDGALTRISASISDEGITEMLMDEYLGWDFAERHMYAEAAKKFYDWRAIGVRLDQLIEEARHGRTDAARS